jgi:hypothetical protein
MDIPKILTWMARKADIPDALAHSLWRRAAAEAAHATGQRSGTAFSEAALARLETLIEQESSQQHPFGLPPSTTWVWPQQRRIAALVADLTTALSRVRWPAHRLDETLI